MTGRKPTKNRIRQPDKPNRKSEGIRLVLGRLDTVVRRHAAREDPLEHLEHLDVGSAVQRSPQRADARRTGREQIGAGRADGADGLRAAVLFVVGVQDEDQVQRVFDLRRDNVLPVRQGEHHVQKVGTVPQLGIGINERPAARATIGERRDRADLADQPSGGLGQRLDVLQRQKLLVVTCQIAQRRRQDRHRRGIDGNVLQLVFQAFVQQLVVGQLTAEGLQFLAVRQAAEDQQPGHLHKVGFVGELFDRDPAIAQDALVPVDIGNCTLAGRRVAQTRIVGNHAELIAELADVNRHLAIGRHQSGQFDLLLSKCQHRFFGHEPSPSVFYARFGKRHPWERWLPWWPTIHQCNR